MTHWESTHASLCSLVLKWGTVGRDFAVREGCSAGQQRTHIDVRRAFDKVSEVDPPFRGHLAQSETGIHDDEMSEEAWEEAWEQ